MSGCYGPLSQQVLQGSRGAYIPRFFPLLLSLPPQKMKKIQGATSTTQTRVCRWFVFSFFKNYVVDKLEETLRQVVLNGSYCGSLKCEPTENDRDTYCIHKHRLPASETKL